MVEASTDAGSPAFEFVVRRPLPEKSDFLTIPGLDGSWSNQVVHVRWPTLSVGSSKVGRRGLCMCVYMQAVCVCAHAYMHSCFDVHASRRRST